MKRHHNGSTHKKAQGSANSTRASRADHSTRKTPAASTIANGKASARGWLFTGLTHRSLRSRRAAFWRERLRVKEQWLREEIRANRTLMLSLFQWGLAVLAAIETCLYYVRRDVSNNLALHGALPPYGTVPPGRWFVGTTILIIVAAIFCSMAKYMINRHVAYRTQLLTLSPSFSGIREGPTGGRINRYHYLLFFTFPVMDSVLWFYFRLTGSITIPW